MSSPSPSSAWYHGAGCVRESALFSDETTSSRSHQAPDRIYQEHREALSIGFTFPDP